MRFSFLANVKVMADNDKILSTEQGKLGEAGSPWVKH